MIGRVTNILQLVAVGILMPTLAIAQEPSGDDEVLRTALEQPIPEDLFGPMPLVGAIGLFAVIIAAMYFASQRERRKQAFLAGLLQKDQVIPRELLPVQPSREREMRRGIWLLSLGLGLGLVLYIVTGEWLNAAWCLIVLFLAAASFINAAFFYPGSEGRRHGENGE